jgi:hypothetical protein
LNNKHIKGLTTENKSLNTSQTIYFKHKIQEFFEFPRYKIHFGPSNEEINFKATDFY